MTNDNPVAAYNRERDAVLLTGDVDQFIAFGRRHSPNYRPTSRDVAEIAMHKAITGVRSLPMEYRRKSFKWLRDRGYGTLDDGDLG